MNNTDQKLTYEKPVLRKIELKAEEVLASGCKIGGTGGPVAVCVSIEPCFDNGS